MPEAFFFDLFIGVDGAACNDKTFYESFQEITRLGLDGPGLRASEYRHVADALLRRVQAMLPAPSGAAGTTMMGHTLQTATARYGVGRDDVRRFGVFDEAEARRVCAAWQLAMGLHANVGGILDGSTEASLLEEFSPRPNRAVAWAGAQHRHKRLTDDPYNVVGPRDNANGEVTARKRMRVSRSTDSLTRAVSKLNWNAVELTGADWDWPLIEEADMEFIAGSTTRPDGALPQPAAPSAVEGLEVRADMLFAVTEALGTLFPEQTLGTPDSAGSGRQNSGRLQPCLPSVSLTVSWWWCYGRARGRLCSPWWRWSYGDARHPTMSPSLYVGRWLWLMIFPSACDGMGSRQSASLGDASTVWTGT